MVWWLTMFGCGAVPPAVEAPTADPPDAVADVCAGVPVPPVPAAPVPATSVQRLTVAEIDAILGDLLDQRSTRYAEAWLPADLRVPFDGDVRAQEPGADWISAYEAMVGAVLDDLAGDPVMLASLLGCPLEDPARCDGARVVRDLGRTLFRRPLTPDEVALFDAVMAERMAVGDLAGAGLDLLRDMLQDVAFLYRIERGAPHPDDPSVTLLTPWEVATRIAFLVTGAPPDAALAAAADACALYDPAAREAAVRRLAGTDAALAAAARFHAMWIGYETPAGYNPLNDAFRLQADRMVTQLLPGGPWSQLLTTPDTWLNGALAAHHGVEVAGEGWVVAPDPRRAGLLSWGAFLASGPASVDSSPTYRGQLVQQRLLCAPVPPPPPGVEGELPDARDATCKADRFDAHRADPGCAGCHVRLDGVGFGLERFDMSARYREVEDEDPGCAIDGQGEVPGLGAFAGPAELGALLVDAGAVQPCLVEHLLHHHRGRPPDDPVEARALAAAWGDGTWADLLVAVARADTFVFRGEVP